MAITLKEAQDALAAIGMTLQAIPDAGEFVINYAKRVEVKTPYGAEAFGGLVTEHYVRSLRAALDDGRFMARVLQATINKYA